MIAKKSIRNLQRYWQVQSIFLRYGFDIMVDQDEIQKVRQYIRDKRKRQPDEFDQYSTPERVRLMLQELGPTFVKLGQMAASQTNSLPPAWVEELQKLQSEVPPFPEEGVREIIISELGAPLEEVFDDFDLQPLAAASIGQVHRAVLVDNQPVVVKVQRPDIVPQIEADIAIMQEVAGWLEKTTTWAKNYGAVDIVDEFAYNLQDELDYRNEARNADRLRNNMVGIARVHIPEIQWNLVTTRVLTMERIQGVKITNTGALDEAGIDREAVVETFMRSMIHQLLVDGFFHGDPHPGNVFVNLDDAQIIFLDTGMMGRLAEDQRTGIINLLKALRNSDAVEIVRIAMTIGVIHKPVDQRALRRDIDRLLNRYLSAALSDIPFAEVLSKILILIFNRGIRLPSELTLALKALIQTEEIARTLNPEIQVADVTQTLTKHLFMEQLKPETIMARFNSGIAELFQLAPQLYGAISQLLKQVQSGKLTVELDASDLPRQLQEFTVIANRFTIGLTLAGMTVGSALTMSVSPENTWSFIPLLGTIGFIVSMVGGSLLVFGVMWEMWRKR